jgi:hypothetical protein
MGIWAAGALLYTLLLKFAIPVYTGKLRFETGGNGDSVFHRRVQDQLRREDEPRAQLELTIEQ